MALTEMDRDKLNYLGTIHEDRIDNSHRRHHSSFYQQI